MDLATIARMDATAQFDAVRRGDLSHAELWDACLRRIEAIDPLIRSVVEVSRDSRPRAERAAPFAGVPLLVKDVMPWPGLRWSMGSRLFAANVARTETPFGRRLSEAGFVCAGKSAMSELGLLASAETLLEGITHNPWDLSRSPAGSSGGSAAAVAAGIVPIAHANDGGGSIRMPASACGVLGFKPSKGRTVEASLVSSAWLDMTTDGCVSRTVRDAARFMSIVEDRESSLPPMGFVDRPLNRTLRVAAWRQTLSGAEPDAAVRRAYEETAALLTAMGHVVELAPAPVFDDALGDAFMLVAGAAVAALVDAQDRARGEPVQEAALEPFTWSLVHAYEERGPGGLAAAREAFARAVGVYRDATAGYDVVLTPTLAVEPWLVGHLGPLVEPAELRARVARCVAYTPIQNIAGAPAMSVPLHVSEGGLPIGMHFAAAPGQDALLLGLAYALEEARPWSERWPPWSIPALERARSATT